MFEKINKKTRLPVIIPVFIDLLKNKSALRLANHLPSDQIEIHKC
jgi:hypothetical protein